MVKLLMRMVVKALEKEKQFSQLEIWCYQDSFLSHLGIVIIMMIISISHVHDKYEGSRYIKYSDCYIIMTTTSTSRRRSARKGEREARRRLEVAWLPSLKEFIVIRIHAMITIQMMLGFCH